MGKPTSYKRYGYPMLPPILQRVKSAGFKVFDNGRWDVNLVAIRSKDRTAGAYDDLICIAAREYVNGPRVCRYYPCTVDPGAEWEARGGMRPEGVAVVANGQHRGAYSIGIHRRGSKTAHEALVQTGPIAIYRDANRDGRIDMTGPRLEGQRVFCNIHKGGTYGQAVGLWSAGCTAIPRPWFTDFMYHIKKQIEFNPSWKTYTYTILPEE